MIGVEIQLQKSRKGILKKSQTRIPQSASYLISTVRKTPDEDQWWGIIDEEIMVWKYDFEEEICVLDPRTGESQN